MKISNQVYDILKWIAQLVLPGLGTLYFALSNIWGLPYGEQVLGTITAIDTFLGLCLGISTAAYNKSPEYGDGTLEISEASPTKDIYRLNLRTPLDEIAEKDRIALRVDNQSKQ